MRRVCLLSVLGVLAWAAPASAHFAPGHYTHDRCPINPPYSRVDPVNVVFYGWGTWDRVARSIERHAWWWDQGGSTQYFVDHGNCYRMTTQRASGGVSSTRFHVRLHPIHWDSVGGWTTIGDAHHEDFIWYCGHAVDANGPSGSGFDQGRRELSYRMRAGGHMAGDQWWGNTQNMRQCDGDYARSNGYTAYIDHHQAYH